MKILMLLEKISSGAQALRLKNVISEMNVVLWKQYRDDNGVEDEYVYVPFIKFRNWCLTNKIDYIESVLLKFGKELAPSLAAVKIMDGDVRGTCFYRPSERKIFMHKKKGIPVVPDSEIDGGLSKISDFLSTFIHELYHAMQYDRGDGESLRKYNSKPVSSDNKVWHDASVSTKTYHSHSVTPIEIEAIANDTFFTAIGVLGVKDVEMLHKRYPTWSEFMKGMRDHEVDPETYVHTQRLFKRRDGTAFELDHPIEGKMVKMFIKEFLKVAQNFYYGGIEDDSGKFKKQRELGKQRKHAHHQQKVADELEDYMKNNTGIEKVKNLEELDDFANLINRYFLVDIHADVPMLRSRLNKGQDINDWLFSHIPPEVVEHSGIKGFDVTIKLTDFETFHNITVENGIVHGIYFSLCIDSFDELTPQLVEIMLSQFCYFLVHKHWE